MPETIALKDAVEIAVVERNGFIESRHAGVAVVLSPAGEVITELGDASALILPRSTMKPLQSIACTTAGVDLAGEQLVLSTASHTGTDRHAEIVRQMLSCAGFTEDDLLCPPAWPSDSATRDEMVRRGEGPARIRMNCSGKHAAMLLACRAAGWDPRTYTDPAHPLQVHIREVVERFVSEKTAATTIDGCGAPVYAISVLGLARAIHRVGTAGERSPFALHRAAATLVRTVREHPWAIEGPGQADSQLIEHLGVFTKLGAEGVMIMVAPDGTTAVVKTLDGSLRASSAVSVELLTAAGALTTEQRERALGLLDLDVLGGGVPVGRIRATVG